MNQSRRLSLHRETLTQLTSHDLQAVVGGAAAIITDKLTACLTDLAPSNTWMCTDGC